MSNLPRRAFLVGTASAIGLMAVPATVNAEVSIMQPDIDDTDAWGANPPNGTVPILDGQPNKIILHHTVSTNTDDFSRDQAHAHAQWCQELHQDGNGWVDTGYNFIVSRGGYITEGATGSLSATQDGSSFAQGAHTAGENDQSVGLSAEGTYSDGASPPADQWDSMVALAAWVANQYDIPSAEIYGHQDFSSTACPGEFQDRLGEFRDAVDAAR